MQKGENEVATCNNCDYFNRKSKKHGSCALDGFIVFESDTCPYWTAWTGRIRRLWVSDKEKNSAYLKSRKIKEINS